MGCGASAKKYEPGEEPAAPLVKADLKKLEAKSDYLTWALALETQKAIQVELPQAEVALESAKKSETQANLDFLKKVVLDLESLDTLMQERCEEEEARKDALHEFLEQVSEEKTKRAEQKSSKKKEQDRAREKTLVDLEKGAEALLKSLNVGLEGNVDSEPREAKKPSEKGMESGRPLLLRAIKWKANGEGRIWFESDAARWLDEAAVGQAAAEFKLKRKEANTWLEFGLQGGGIKDGRKYEKKKCFEKALEIDPTYASAWQSLGMLGGGDVKGTNYGKVHCFSNALEAETVQAVETDPKRANAWDRDPRSFTGGRKSLMELVEKEPENASAWNNLGILGGGTVNTAGRTRKLTPKQCYIQALQADRQFVHAWNNLGYEGGGTVTCETKGTVGMKTFSKKQCYIEALEIDPKNTLAWNNLGVLGGGNVHGMNLTRFDCLSRGSDKPTQKQF